MIEFQCICIGILLTIICFNVWERIKCSTFEDKIISYIAVDPSQKPIMLRDVPQPFRETWDNIQRMVPNNHFDLDDLFVKVLNTTTTANSCNATVQYLPLLCMSYYREGRIFKDKIDNQTILTIGAQRKLTASSESIQDVVKQLTSNN